MKTSVPTMNALLGGNTLVTLSSKESKTTLPQRKKKVGFLGTCCLVSLAARNVCLFLTHFLPELIHLSMGVGIGYLEFDNCGMYVTL
jgi:hypothetical protein